jgi:hypothetical protein
MPRPLGLAASVAMPPAAVRKVILRRAVIATLDIVFKGIDR